MIVHKKMQSSKWFKSNIATGLFILKFLRYNKIDLYGWITNALDVFAIYFNVCCMGVVILGITHLWYVDKCYSLRET